jgi:hypothetical protein
MMHDRLGQETAVRENRFQIPRPRWRRHQSLIRRTVAFTKLIEIPLHARIAGWN